MSPADALRHAVVAAVRQLLLVEMQADSGTVAADRGMLVPVVMMRQAHNGLGPLKRALTWRRRGVWPAIPAASCNSASGGPAVPP